MLANEIKSESVTIFYRNATCNKNFLNTLG
jgi:hypothetical protein